MLSPFGRAIFRSDIWLPSYSSSTELFRGKHTVSVFRFSFRQGRGGHCDNILLCYQDGAQGNGHGELLGHFFPLDVDVEALPPPKPTPYPTAANFEVVRTAKAKPTTAVQLDSLQTDPPQPDSLQTDSKHPPQDTDRADKRLNVLFILSDDLRPQLGVYGQRAYTPHLEKLASEGTTFEHCYAQVRVTLTAAVVASVIADQLLIFWFLMGYCIVFRVDPAMISSGRLLGLLADKCNAALADYRV